MSKIIENQYSLLITLSAKIIFDFKIKEENWLDVTEYVKTFVGSNVKNEGYAIKLIKEQLIEVEPNIIKILKNDFNQKPECKKCYFKLIDWIIQINLKRKRLARSVNKKLVAKHIVFEELMEANKYFIDQKIINSISVEKIIDVSIQTYIKNA